MLGAGLRKNLLHPYNSQNRLAATLRYLEWQARRRLGRPWRRKFWDDRIITLYPDSSESMWLLYNVVMDWPEFPFIARYLRRGDTAIDVGANIGAYVLWISRFLDAGGRLIAFEPVPETYARLSEQISQNGLRGIVLERRAVTNIVGSIQITTGKDMENHILTGAGTVDGSLTVETVTLDEYVRSKSIPEVHFLKIDVEGAEPLVLEGADSLLKERRIAVVQLEVGEHWKRFGRELSSTAERLQEYGYLPFVPDGDGNALARVGDWEAALRGQNLFVTRSAAEVSNRLDADS